jgi:tetratricopeptide (TPR) repeat protein
MPRFLLLRPLVACTLSALVPLAQAQMLKDPALEALYQADRHDELQRVAATRVAAAPDDAQAVLGVALAALARDDAPARQAAIQRAEACIEKQPKAAPCQYALGVVLGIQAMSEGMFKAARSAGTIRDALQAAHEIEPAWFPARSALSEFYLMAPGMMGGSTAKAAELARSAPRPEQARLLEARGAMAAKKFELALPIFMALPTNLEATVSEDARAWAVQCVLGLVGAGQAAQAAPLAEKLAREQGRYAQPVFALARVRAESGAHEEALKLYEQAATLKGAEDLPITYRSGIVLQALGRKAEAKAAFTRYIASPKGSKNSKEDAKKRLEQLEA